MMEEALHREYRPAWLGHRRDARPKTALLPGTVWTLPAGTFDRAAQHGSPLWASPDVPLWGLKPRRAETRLIALLTAVRRIGAAIRLWPERSRSRQQLRELSDHMLKDIGLTRAEVGHEFPQPFRHYD
ncbi:MAG: DUF1127 domain-containing protein [Stellaceae bacterium]|jgi:uncharacterized protein YjiS (DUF1127 family)